jgi:hypothetical protein
MLKRQRRKVLAAIGPELEEEEEVKGLFIGQYPIPPLLLSLEALLFIWVRLV